MIFVADESLAFHANKHVFFIQLMVSSGKRIEQKKIFTVGVVRHWNRMLQKVVDAPALEAFRGRLDGALGNVV